MIPTSLLYATAATAHIAMNFDIHRGSSLEDAQFGKRAQYISKRDNYFSGKLINEQSYYIANITVGTPGQEIGVLIDTGSSDLWVMDASNPYCGSSSSSSASAEVEAKLQSMQATKSFKKSSSNFKKLAYGKRDLESREDDASTFTTTAPVSEETQGKNIFSQMQSFINSAESDLGIGGGGVYSTYTISGGSDTDSGFATQASDVSSSEATLNCESYGTFDESSSTSYKSNDTEFIISYGDNTFASGTWVTDTLSFANVSLENFSFALANESNSTMGVFGIGMEKLESTYSGSASNTQFLYQNYPARLVQDGIIKRNLYSLYLNDKDASSGVILFGAVDHAKYTGDLSIVQIVNSLKNQGYDEAIRFDVTLSSVSVSSSSSKVSSSTISSDSYPALLDSGTTLIYAPPSFVKSLGVGLGGTYSSNLGGYVLDCSMGKENINITFDFTGAKIQVPLENLLVSVSSSRVSSSSSTSTCALGVFSSGENMFMLGDSFLRAAYVVYDLDNKQVALAQAKLSVTTSDIEEVSATGAIPSAVSAASYSNTFSGTLSEATDSVSSSSSGSNSGSSSSNSGKTSDGSKIASSILAFVFSIVGFFLII